MFNKTKKLLGVFFVLSTLAFAGCAHRMSSDVSELQSQLRQKDETIRNLESSNRNKDSLIAQYQKEIGEHSKAASDARMQYQAATEASEAGGILPQGTLLPPQASPGECYARAFVPPTYRTMTEKVLAQSASERVEIIPARYEWVEERVLVEPPSSRMEKVPAEYKWESKRILVKPAHTTWKKGRGLIEKVDHTTGEIMCLVEIPAQYKTVKQKVMVKSPSHRLVEIPAAYKTVKVRKLVSPSQERRIAIPAQYQTIRKTEQVSEGKMEWRRVLCETNVTPQIISRLQSALLKAGYNPGPIDGILGRRTNAAVSAYQKKKGFATGGLTYETLKSLGVKLG